MHGERGQQAADVTRVALRALRPGAVADELLEGGSALVAAEFVEETGRSVPPWEPIGPAIRNATANAWTIDRVPARGYSRQGSAPSLAPETETPPVFAQACDRRGTAPPSVDCSQRGRRLGHRRVSLLRDLSLIHISEPTRLGMISYAV